MTESFDILIKNATIIDGTGGPARKGSLGIRGEMIVEMGKVMGDASREIDGSGLVACPGFIDAHSHADRDLLRYPLAENFIMQGVTTFIGGNCGMSMAPVNNLFSSSFVSAGEWWKETEPDQPTPPLLIPLDKYGEMIEEKLGYSIDWETFGEYLTKVEEIGTAINFAPLVGHGTVRTAVMGEDFMRAATKGEVEAMCDYVDEAMQSGAFGLSTGVDYFPGEYATVDELVELAKVAAGYGGLHVPHFRHVHIHWSSDDPKEVAGGIFHGPEEDAWIGRYRGLLETIEVSRRSKAALHITHLDNVFRIPQPHPDYLEEAASRATLDIVDAAIEEGIDVTFDVIICPPTDIGGAKQLISEFWRSSSSVLNHLKKLEKGEFIEALKTQELRDEIKRASEIGRLSIGMTHTKADPFWMTRFMILRCSNKQYEGRTLMELSAEKGTEPLDTLFDILIEDPETLWLQTNDERAREATKRVFLNHPAAMPCTDMTVFPAKPSEDLPVAMFSYTPPMAYGLFADYIGSWVKEKKMLSLEDAIRKATHSPAKMLGLDDRGFLRPGAFADIVVFDYDKIRLAGDYLKPAQPPEGIEYVLVNGEVVFEGKEHTGVKSGKVLRRR